MKKNNKILIIIGILVIALICTFIILNKNNDTIEERVLVQELTIGGQSFFSNTKTPSTAIIICESGNIYCANLDEFKGYYTNMVDINNYVINEGIKLNKVAKKSEINKIKQEATTLENDLEAQGGFNVDEVTTTELKVYDSVSDRYITLAIYGPLNQKNTSSISEELLELINKIIDRKYKRIYDYIHE